MNVVVAIMNDFNKTWTNQHRDSLSRDQLINIRNRYNLTPKQFAKVIKILIHRDMIQIFGGHITSGIISKALYVKLTDKANKYYEKELSI